VERDDRPPVATFYVTVPLEGGAVLELTEAAAHHARVKRLEVRDRVQLTNGRGSLAVAELRSLDRKRATAYVELGRHVARPSDVHVRVPIGDRDRMLLLAEKATELGITTWQAVRFRRSLSVSPRGEGESFGEKVEARMIAALEQSGGAWLPGRLADCGVDAIDVNGAASRVLLDPAGQPLLRLALAPAMALLFGPEGGLEPTEREFLLANGWQLASLAENTLRFETAGIAAVSVARALRLANL
jgi:16S rRNA (uracil1498-N3)-methyltransferase